ncbi:PepSY domain-containing protein [Paracoccus panacisoli]|uniref:Peptidase propeptide and YPEB domain-containing protein n=2 Tax=Paracoccus TaxID=265 RepID=A0A1H2RIA5_9RHOB|nr:PepSY domain-containing protein [Paracoccus sanguinis]QJD17692.1 PepSY domain-containing protein [Paracoccus sanguinis]SDW19203.1 Peptidase propeptide and YPEB domain-containing protein [Paracoccus sanguinis]
MRLTIAAAALMGLTALTPAFAAEVECKQPEASWKPVEELKTKLTAEGWTIKNVKTDEGCYEVYATDKDGKKVEVYFDPVTFEPVGEDS